MDYSGIRRVDVCLLSQRSVIIDPKYIMSIDLMDVKRRLTLDHGFSETQYAKKSFIRIYKEHWNKDYEDKEAFQKACEEIIAQLETAEIISIKFEFEDDLPIVISTNWGSTVQRNYHVDNKRCSHYAINIEPK